MEIDSTFKWRRKKPLKVNEWQPEKASSKEREFVSGEGECMTWRERKKS